MHFPTEMLRQCWFLAGPTACGKSEVGLLLAERFGAEIVSLDSMSLYRGMDIGTAKPSAEDRRRVPHHLIDVIEPHEEFSLAQYVEAASNACREILNRGRVPLFVGGTGLYLRGILRGVFDGPPADWDLRKRLEAEAAEHEPDYLHQQLKDVDPASAEQLHPHDTRRLVRALEVYHVTGRPLSHQQQQPPLPVEQRPPHVYWLLPPRDWLYEQINHRVMRMIDAGLVEETRRLLSAPRGLTARRGICRGGRFREGEAPAEPSFRGPSTARQEPRPPEFTTSGDSLSRTARQALGYKEIIDHLEGRSTLDEAIETIQRRTRQFAKRQHTWFRNLEECESIGITGRDSPEDIAAKLQEASPHRACLGGTGFDD